MAKPVYTDAMTRKADKLVAAHLDRSARWLRAWAERKLDHLTTRREFWIMPGSIQAQAAAKRAKKPPVAHWVAVDGTGCTCRAARESQTGFCTHKLAAEILAERYAAIREARARQAEILAERATAALNAEDRAAEDVAGTFLGRPDRKEGWICG